MLMQIEGSQAVAKAVALCRPEVIAAYPISPQTHIVEALSRTVKAGDLSPCRFVNVESEFAALSMLIGASATGARTYTATASQGLLFMAEAVYNAAGLGFPIVMTIANRALGAPINIWNDHSDSMSMRDSGWIQLYAEDNQEAIDLHIQAFRLAERLSCPVMVCMDGYVLTHAMERVEMPVQELVDSYLPRFEPTQILDPQDPVSIGAMVGPEAFSEVRYLMHHKQIEALDIIEGLSQEFSQIFGRSAGGLVTPYRIDDAEIGIITMGSVLGTVKDTVDELRESRVKVGCIKLGTYRPFPDLRLRELIQHLKRVIVIDRAAAPGIGGIVANDVKMAVRGLTIPVHAVIAGLGGRSIWKASLVNVIQLAMEGTLENIHWLDLNWPVINQELTRQKQRRRSGPVAESVVQQVNAISVRPV